MLLVFNTLALPLDQKGFLTSALTYELRFSLFKGDEAISGPQEEVAKMVSAFSQRQNYILDWLNKIPGVSCYKPVGAFYVFPNFSSHYRKSYQGKRISNSTELADFFLDVARVAVVPGIEFGADPFKRLSYATSMEDIKEGIDRIEEALKKLI